MSKKLESTLKNMVLCLFLMSVIMAGALGFVYKITKDPIEQADKQKEIQAVKDVLPPFDNDPTADARDMEGLKLYTATQKGEPVGYAVKTFTEKGFSGHFELMVGFKPDGTINKIVVLNHSETPGLGSKMKEPKFADQFNGMNIGTIPGKQLKVKKDGGTVDAITAATISSRAYCDGVQKAFNVYMNMLNKNQANVDTTSGATSKGGKK
ncbi:MAG TPA: RnfABCDGE type electron transport complex subunit G [Bacteroidales bacterium]|nr:RnfABCDGE type electron transport complex subunit G [Bacteroidales bacterium]HPT01964.1 RnfABCDGE type electron transport complex subunit G [Bacteroidales bacterium]